MFAAVLGSHSGGDSKVQVLYGGDDAGAKDTVRRLAESIGLEPVSRPLANARYLEQRTRAVVFPLTSHQ